MVCSFLAQVVDLNLSKVPVNSLQTDLAILAIEKVMLCDWATGQVSTSSALSMQRCKRSADSAFRPDLTSLHTI